MKNVGKPKTHLNLMKKQHEQSAYDHEKRHY